MEKRVIWHDMKPQNGPKKTVVVLWNGDDRYVGVANVGGKDVFNRRKGREIAGGRAKHLLDVKTAGKRSRPSDQAEKGMFVFSVKDIPAELLALLPRNLYEETRPDGK